MKTLWVLLVAFQAVLLSWYIGVHPLTWLGLPVWLSLVLAFVGWWLWAALLGSAWWVCLAFGLTCLNRLGRWAWCLIPFIWCWGLWLFEQLPVGLPWASPGIILNALLGWTPLPTLIPETLVTAVFGIGLTVWVQRKQQLQKPLARYHNQRITRLMGTALVVLALLGGVFNLLLPQRPEKPIALTQRSHPHWPVPLYILQPNTPIAVIRGTEVQQIDAAQRVLNTLKANPAPPGTIWLLPEEGALPGIVPIVKPTAQVVFAAYQRLIDARGWFLLVGATTQSVQGGFYNSMLLIQPSAPPQVLHKRRLVPFGEMAPLGTGALMQAVANYTPTFSTGPNQQRPLTAKFNQYELTLWPLICSEALYADFWPPQGNNPQGVVVASANLGWFQQRPNPWLAFWWQQLLHYRSQQTGWPVVSAANQGPSF